MQRSFGILIKNRCRFVIFGYIRYTMTRKNLSNGDEPAARSKRGHRQGSSDDHLYLQVAGGIEKMIGEEILKIGDKLPSVRVLSEEYGISMGTAFQAYYHLEGKGLIEARPRSGYYVRFNFRRMPGLPRTAAPEPVASEVSVQEMITTVFNNMSSDDVVNFSVAA